MKDKTLHEIISKTLNLNSRLFIKTGFEKTYEDYLLSYRKDRYRRVLKESKYFEQLERQKRLLNQKASMSKTHMNMLKKFECELKTKKLNFIDKKVLKEVINVMRIRLNNEELFLMEKLENFKKIKQNLGL